MSIQHIRYWDATELHSSLPPLSTIDKKSSKSIFDSYSQSFDLKLLDLFGQGSTYSKPLYANSFFGFDLNSPEQLGDASQKAKSMGMEKVLAAQLSSPLPFYGSNSNSRGKNNSHFGLSNIANLTIQLELAKAQKVFDAMKKNEAMSLQDFINSVSENETRDINESTIKNNIENTIENNIIEK